MQGPPQGPPACAASTGVSFPAHQHREDSASPTSARSCTARLAARLAAPGCAAHPRGPPRARCPNLPRTQARAESVLHAPSWTRRLLAAPVHPARPRSPALDTCAARARRWPAPARLRQHAHRLSRWLFAIERTFCLITAFSNLDFSFPSWLERFAGVSPASALLVDNRSVVAYFFLLGGGE